MVSKSPPNTGVESETTAGSKSQSKKKKMTPGEQSARFIETARELECDESGEAFKKFLSNRTNKG